MQMLHGISSVRAPQDVVIKHTFARYSLSLRGLPAAPTIGSGVEKVLPRPRVSFFSQPVPLHIPTAEGKSRRYTGKCCSPFSPRIWFEAYNLSLSESNEKERSACGQRLARPMVEVILLPLALQYNSKGTSLTVLETLLWVCLDPNICLKLKCWICCSQLPSKKIITSQEHTVSKVWRNQMTHLSSKVRITWQYLRRESFILSGLRLHSYSTRQHSALYTSGFLDQIGLSHSPSHRNMLRYIRWLLGRRVGVKLDRCQMLHSLPLSDNKVRNLKGNCDFVTGGIMSKTCGQQYVNYTNWFKLALKSSCSKGRILLRYKIHVFAFLPPKPPIQGSAQ